jgi:hypothetical protein
MTNMPKTLIHPNVPKGAGDTEAHVSIESDEDTATITVETDTSRHTFTVPTSPLVGPSD